MIAFDLRACEFACVHLGTCTLVVSMLKSSPITHVTAFQSVGKHSSVVCCLLSAIPAEQWPTSKGLQRTTRNSSPLALSWASTFIGLFFLEDSYIKRGRKPLIKFNHKPWLKQDIIHQAPVQEIRGGNYKHPSCLKILEFQILDRHRQKPELTPAYVNCPIQEQGTYLTAHLGWTWDEPNNWEALKPGTEDFCCY